ncbi:ABC transporter substrate-binding protein [Candidatus Poriferisodalis sp.]|uniref:ABC transporter substrate-binding protein n=1 Tax=Candidatus Poriferisodalis sp. TaxID=3101277 RepID=UPI003B025E1F
MITTTGKAWRLLAVVFAFAVLAAACGSDDAADDATDEAQTQTTAAESTMAPDDDDHGDDHDDDDGDDHEDGDDHDHGDEDGEHDHDDDGMDGGSNASDGMAGDGEAEVELISDECPIPNPSEVVEIDAMGWEFPIISQYEKELEDCEEGNYRFNLQFLDSVEARSAMTADAATGSPTFELYQGSNAFIGELANQGFLLPLNGLVEKYRDQFDLDEIDDAFWRMASIGDQIYALPMVSNTMHVFYNKPAMDELGLAVPTTFEEAFETCRAIIDADYDIGFLYMLSAGWAWQIEFDSVLGSMGVSPIDPMTGAPNFNGPEGVMAAQTLKRMVDECAPDAAGSYSTDDVQAAFQTGEAILGHTWASRAAGMDDPEASTVVGDIEFAPALGTGGDIVAAPAYIDGWGIPVGTPADKVEAIFLAMLAATDLESMQAAAEFGLVTRNGVSHPNGPRDAAAAQASLVNGRGADLTHPAAGIARAKLGEALITILDGTPIEEALQAAEDAYLAEAGDQGLLN